MIARFFYKIPCSAITPEGYMRRQLELQAAGLTGNISSLWEDLSDNSGWLGGRGESWERGPYFMDGLLPLAALLQDENLEKQALMWVNAVIASQREDGFFGPPWNRDWWPRLVVLKALVSYYGATGDPRVIPFMERFLRYFYEHVDREPPYFWAAARALEAGEAIELVYRETGGEYLPALVHKLKEYMYDWFACLGNFPYRQPMTAYINRTILNFLKNLAEPVDELLKKRRKIRPPRPKDKILKFNGHKIVRLLSLTHGVNIAMALKYPVTYGMLTGRKEYYPLPRRSYEQLMKYHGTAAGLWTADEHLSGPNPANGIELCAVVELMYSLEELLSITGDPAYADLLELVAYNALPATFTPDMCCHQYVQQVNQIAANVKRRQFYDTKSDANVYGLEPNYGCCTANMHQGFPKFAANACYQTAQGLAFMLYLPCTVRTEYRGRPLAFRVSTEYPFREQIKIEMIEGPESDLDMTLRIPALTSGEIFYNGVSEGPHPAGLYTLQKNFRKGDLVEINLEAPVTVCANPDGSISLRKGSLLLALRLKEIYQPLKGREPFNYRQYVSGGAWNYAPLLREGKAVVLGEKTAAVPPMPFDPDAPPLIVTVKGVKVLNWKEKQHSAGPYPTRPEPGTPVNLEMVPYGCTNIRMAQFPIIKEA